MPKRRPKKRNYRMIAFKVYYDTDEDILDWWEGIEAGDRSDAIRDLIREQLGQPQRRTGKIIDLPELMEVRRDTIWIKDALNDMPAYLERVVQQVAATAQVGVGHPARASPEVIAEDEPALTDAETQRRTRKMKGATW
jgi:Arc/MetJ-type ribon-helix-helix transcriptional regulator